MRASDYSFGKDFELAHVDPLRRNTLYAVGVGRHNRSIGQQDQYSMNDNGSGGSFIGLTATIVSAYVSNN